MRFFIIIIVVVTVTAYTSCDETMRCDGVTYSGVQASHGVVAANDLPLGSIVVIQGYGAGIVLDRGSGLIGINKPAALNKTHLDVWFADRAEAQRWGRRTIPVIIILPNNRGK